MKSEYNNKQVIRSFKDLAVWEKGIELVTEIYNKTEAFPKAEQFGLTSQLRRAAISIPSNIAEGSTMGSTKHFVNFLRTSLGSCSEVETQIIIARNLKFINDKAAEELTVKITDIQKMLNGLISSLSKKK